MSKATERFVQMLGQFARFDLGRSFFQNKDVSKLIVEKLPVSISLGLWTFFISYLVAVPLGVAKAVRAGSRFDFFTTLPVNKVCAAGTLPVYRAYNNGFARGVDSNHRLSTSRAAIDEVVKRGWNDEGVVMCAPG